MLVLANANVLLAAPDNKLNVTGTDLGRAGRNLQGESAAAGRYHGARPRTSPKALACERGGNRLPQVQVNAPARRWYPGELRLRPRLRGQAAVPATRRE